MGKNFDEEEGIESYLSGTLSAIGGEGGG